MYHINTYHINMYHINMYHISLLTVKWMVKRDDKWFSKKPKWFSATAVGLRRNRQKYKSEMDKSGWKWNSLCGATTL